MEENSVEFIFTIYHLIYKNVFRSNKENATSYEKLYNFQRKNTKTGQNFQKFVPENIVFLGFWAKISS